MESHKIWMEQCEATRVIRESFGLRSALDYLIGEKLLTFASLADKCPECAEELPSFQAEIWNIFDSIEIAGYLTKLKPKQRTALRKLLYLR